MEFSYFFSVYFYKDPPFDTLHFIISCLLSPLHTIKQDEEILNLN